MKTTTAKTKAHQVMTGYHSCACRDCFEIYVGEPGELCLDCEEAGCTACDCEDAEYGCPHGECEAPGAYGDGEEEGDES